MNEVKIVIASSENLEDLRQLGAKTFFETYEDRAPKEAMSNYLKDAFHSVRIKNDIENPNNTFLLACTEAIFIGYAKLKRNHKLDRFKDIKAIELERLYVLKDFIGKKVGKALMEASFLMAKNEGYEVLWLQVEKVNSRAIDFYEKWGFVKFGETTFQVGEHVTEDLLMEKTL